jgi:hypothetical protein
MGTDRTWVHPDAIEEAQAAYQFCHKRNPEIAEAFLSELDRAIEFITKGPSQWAFYVAGTRRFQMRRFPYEKPPWLAVPNCRGVQTPEGMD